MEGKLEVVLGKQELVLGIEELEGTQLGLGEASSRKQAVRAQRC